MDISTIKQLFHELTGLTAVCVSQLGFNLWAIEASDGNTYHLK